jgi:hypothetical protein
MTNKTKERLVMKPNTWYEIGIEWIDGGTETVESDTNLKDAKTKAQALVNSNNPDYKTIFIDKWFYEEEGDYNVVDNNFNALYFDKPKEVV